MLENYIYNHKGAYLVGGVPYANKLEACLALNRIPGDHHVHWDYHEHVYDHQPWTHEPPVSIEELYRQRALQLREQYDHLVLFYSGGADSHTILQTFIKNNIKIDEVFCFGAFKAEELEQVGGLYNKLIAFLQSTGAIAPPAAPTEETN
jgi:hypothetical protein